VAAIYSGTGGYLDRIKVERIREFHEMMLQRLHSEDSDLMEQIAEGNWDDSIEERLSNCIAEAIDDFGPDFDAEGNPIEEGESDRILSKEEREKGARTEEGRASGDGDGGGDSGDDTEGEGETAETEARAEEDEEPGKEKDAEEARA
jgi:hypothetical protein